MADPITDERTVDGPEAFGCRLERELPLSPEQVWPYLASAEGLERWCCPNPDLELTVISEPREGGELFVNFGGQWIARGRYLEAEEPSRLSTTWEWEHEPGAESVLAYELHAEGAATRLVLTHSGFGSQEEADNHEGSWATCLDRLEAGLAGVATSGALLARPE